MLVFIYYQPCQPLLKLLISKFLGCTLPSIDVLYTLIGLELHKFYIIAYSIRQIYKTTAVSSHWIAL